MNGRESVDELKLGITSLTDCRHGPGLDARVDGICLYATTGALLLGAQRSACNKIEFRASTQISVIHGGLSPVTPNVHNEGRAACGPSLSIVGLGHNPGKH
jgi:hypothetical protein